jgi:predicted amidophosphoribosyltransferase
MWDRRWPSLLASLVAPPRCAVCGAGCEPATPACRRCEAALEAASPVVAPLPRLDACWSAAAYDGAARELVGALKFGRLLPLARVAAAMIAAGAPRELLEGALVPVPPAPLRLRLRGLDPAEEIAAELSGLTGLGVAPCLTRSQGPRQVGRPRSERIAAPPGVGLRFPPPPAAILVDDVVTTGATLGACARALRSAGVTRVVALTFARSERSCESDGRA